MKKIEQNKTIFPVASLFAFFWLSVCLAYIPHEETIIKSFLQNRLSKEQITMKFSVSFTKSDTTTPYKTEEEFVFAKSGVLRLSGKYAGGRKLYLKNSSNFITINNEVIVSADKIPFDPIFVLYTKENAQQIISLIKDFGVDTKITGLAHSQNSYAYSIGAKAYDKTSSQIWFDKENFTPAKIIIKNTVSSDFFEYNFSQFEEILKGVLFPKTITLSYNGTLIETKTFISAIETHQPKQFFDIAFYKKKYPKVPTNIFNNANIFENIKHYITNKYDVSL